MNDIPKPPKGYMLAPRGVEYVNSTEQPNYWLVGVPGTGGVVHYKWIKWEYDIRPISWKIEAFDHPDGPFFAIPKPRYRVSLEVSGVQELPSPDR